VEESIVFYENAFGFARKLVTPEKDYGELTTGETTIAFATKKLASQNLSEGFIESNLAAKPFAMELGLVTDDVAGVVEQAISCGAKLVTAPKQKPWGQVVAYIRDRDGFLIEICSPVQG
jgi:lactoylglutathione lyase